MTTSYKTMVVKIGSSTVVGSDGKVNRAFIGGLADQAAALRKLVRTARGVIALDDRADLVHGLLRALALTDQDARAMVP